MFEIHQESWLWQIAMSKFACSPCINGKLGYYVMIYQRTIHECLRITYEILTHRAGPQQPVSWAAQRHLVSGAQPQSPGCYSSLLASFLSRHSIAKLVFHFRNLSLKPFKEEFYSWQVQGSHWIAHLLRVGARKWHLNLVPLQGHSGDKTSRAIASASSRCRSLPAHWVRLMFLSELVG